MATILIGAQRLVSQEHQKWLVKLLGYNFEIHFRPGIGNRAIDELSRVPQVECATLSTTAWLDWDAVAKEIQQDKLFGVLADLENEKVVIM